MFRTGIWCQEHALFKQHKFNRLAEEEGLTNNIINDIIQDTLGHIWVGTEDGLFRYLGDDGFQKFVKESHNNNSLPNNHINGLYVDERNDLWILTQAGIGKYSYENDAIVRFAPDKIHEATQAMFCTGGVCYVDKQDGGLWRIANDTINFLPLYGHRNDTDPYHYRITNMTIAGDVLWMTYWENGVLGMNLEDNTFTYFRPEEIYGQRKTRIYEIFADKEERVWVGTDNGPYLIQKEENDSYGIVRALPDQLPADDYLSMSLDHNNYLWMGTRQNGLFGFEMSAYAEGKAAVMHFLPSINDNSISHRTISKTFTDRTGLLWLGTHNGGINVFDPEGVKVQTITHLPNSLNTINYQNVWGVAESSEGLIWVGTDGKGLNLYDSKKGEVMDLDVPQLQNKAVLCVLEDHKSRVWIGTYQNGLYVYDRRTGKVQSFRTGSADSELTVNDIRCLYESPSNTIYAGTNWGGLYYFDEKNERLTRQSGVYDLDIRAISGTEKDELWMGTFGRGVVYFDPAKDSLAVYQWDNSNNIYNVLDMCKDGNILWLGTKQDGLISFDTKKLTFSAEDIHETFKNSTVQGIVKDDQNNLWLSTNNGVISYNPETHNMKDFDHKDGFQKGQFNQGSIFLSKEGYIVVGGIFGMNIFYPHKILEKSSYPDVVFNEFRILNKKVNPINSEVFPDGESIFLTKGVRLAYDDNFFSVDFMIPGFYSGMQNELEYKLEGYDEEWQWIRDFNTAVYRNVPPGNYRFQIKYRDKTSVIKQLNITITPPLWKTWQAYCLFTALILLTLWRLIKFNNSRLVLREKLAFEKELRLKESRDMKEKLRFYTNFSHELKTPLTLIQGPVNDLIKKTKDKEYLPYLYLIRKNTNVLLRFIGKILEFRKMETNKTLLNLGYHDLNILAQEEAESFAYLAKKQEMKFGFYCETDLYAWVDIEKIQIIMNNLLSNAIKFSGKGQTIKFGVLHEQDHIIIEVKDEGVGISEKEIEKIFTPFYQTENSAGKGGTGIGLALCKNFVELHGGKIALKSKEGQGTQFLIHLPKDKQHLLDKDHVRFVEMKQEETNETILTRSEGLSDQGQTITDSDKVILIVDDNPDITSYISMLFSSGFKVLRAANGRDALDLAIKSAPDLVISDWMMPDMDGLEFCKAVKNTMATSHIPVILLTAKNSDESKIKGYEFGADDYITKPFNSELLIVRVNAILNNRKLIKLRYQSGVELENVDQASPKEVKFILKVQAVILDLLDTSQFNVPDLCRELGLSQTSLYRKIKMLTGDSIQMFIRKVKIKRAAELLISDDYSVSEVAFSLDFSDLKYFRKCFKEQLGMTPSAYRNANASVVEGIKIQEL